MLTELQFPEIVPLDLHVARPATNLAYRWLARDLKAVGWLSDEVRYHDTASTNLT